MLRLIDPGDQFGCHIPEGLDLERLFSRAAADICEAHNALLDPEKRAAALPLPAANSMKPTRPCPSDATTLFAANSPPSAATTKPAA